MSSQKKYAEALTRWGYSIFPLVPGKKIPLVQWSRHLMTTVAEASDWWSTFHDDNIGIATGPSGLLVVDIDSSEALDEWEALWCKKEDVSYEDGRYPLVRTKRGLHIYMNARSTEGGNTTSKLAPGIDTKGQGGMVVGPGSVVAGNSYTVLVRDVAAWQEPAGIPMWLKEKVAKPRRLNDVRRASSGHLFRPLSDYQARKLLRIWCNRIEEAPDGQQNNTINIAAHVTGRDCVDPLSLEDVRGELLAACERGNHPMSRARATIDSGLGWHA